MQFASIAFCLQVLRLPYMAAAALAYVASVIFHFLANRYFTFRVSGKPDLGEAIRYLTIVGVNFMATMLVTMVAVEIFKTSTYVAAVLSILCTVQLTYFAGNRWIFRQREAA